MVLMRECDWKGCDVVKRPEEKGMVTLEDRFSDRCVHLCRDHTDEVLDLLKDRVEDNPKWKEVPINSIDGD